MAVTADLGSESPSQSRTASVTEQFADVICRMRAGDIPDQVIDAATGYVLDWLGCAIAGLTTAPGQALLEHCSDQPRGSVSVLGLTEGRSPQVAALHNGAVSHITEMDDVDRASIIHPWTSWFFPWTRRGGIRARPESPLGRTSRGGVTARRTSRTGIRR